MNTDLLQTDLSKITPRLMEEAMFLAFHEGVSHRALLGHSGPDVYLFGDSRTSAVRFRNYSGRPELLITDTVGNFLFLGSFSAGLPLYDLAGQFHLILQAVLPYIESVAPAAWLVARK